jgi:hypothetical protein
MAVSLVQLVSYSSPALRRRDSLLREHCAVNERGSKPKMEIPEWLMWLRAERALFTLRASKVVFPFLGAHHASLHRVRHLLTSYAVLGSGRTSAAFEPHSECAAGDLSASMLAPTAPRRFSPR